ncbi:hypothetical protein Lalb_Chr24g0399091 [Lupinus albus]|uniref:Uncharacterized protein n=1 Tax=Lupinus albus TaxID=3870 RepID=A0A6A4NHU8_LUPAL|nr:hypothetical protein Lalb_Chr24g0399091 [Lupinus albus]
MSVLQHVPMVLCNVLCLVLFADSSWFLNSWTCLCVFWSVHSKRLLYPLTIFAWVCREILVSECGLEYFCSVSYFVIFNTKLLCLIFKCSYCIWLIGQCCHIALSGFFFLFLYLVQLPCEWKKYILFGPRIFLRSFVSWFGITMSFLFVEILA